MTCEDCGNPKATYRGEEGGYMCDPCWDEEQPTEEEFAELQQITLELAAELGIKPQ